ncbi:STAS domain-containing protein [Amycolatopsis antarctica]|uniref:STAS domain-containing protein n=1 Tax=Amycolatopsis antarctica TaxID=1854586 RepID=UPI0013FE4EBF|nr:STAS domain-containing protein [Amycolatopsis antarctica]
MPATPQHDAGPVPAGSTPRDRGEPRALGCRPAVPVRCGSLSLTVTRPGRGTAAVVVHVAGELDVLTAPALRALLWPRLVCAARTVVVDLSQVTFLGLAGVRVLDAALLRASAGEVDLRVVTGPRCVERALELTGAASRLDCHGDVATALRVAPRPAGRRMRWWHGETCPTVR